MRLLLVVLLRVHPERQADYERFEASAARVVRRHGGRIERRVVLDPSASAAADPPDEVHVVSFPDRASFDRYRGDPEIAALAALRDRAIRETVVWTGSDADPFTGGVP
jgi:uncharacterized protein (DUF1330 family)